MSIILTVLVAIVALSHAGQCQSHYTVVPLMPGTVTALSDSGHVLGREAGTGRIFVWRDGESDFFRSPSGLQIAALDINNMGQVTGYFKVSSPGPDHVFKWDNGVFTDLGTFGIYDQTYMGAINNNGIIAGAASSPGPEWTSFLWENGTFTPILSATPLEPTGINDSIHIVGENGGGGDGYIYRNGQLTALGSLPVDSTSYPQAINASDAVVGWCGSSYRRAFFWKQGTMSPLNTVNSNQSWAIDVNDSDDAVGFVQMVSGQYVFHAFLWKDGAAIDLNSRINPSEGWTLTEAMGINNRGEIACSATRNGQSYAVLLTNRPTILRPVANERWIVGQSDTIRWKSDVPRNYEIRFSRDGGSNFSLITTVAETESMHVWQPPDSLRTSSECIIMLTDALDSSVSFRSAEFTLRAYDLVRPFPDSSLEVFHPVSHGWAFDNNSSETIWPRSWWQTRFNYASGTDPFTMEVYPANIFQQCQFIDGVRSCPTDSDFVDWVSWAETFGIDACYSRSFFGGDPSSYRHHATSWWKRCGEPYRGSCYGLAVSSLLAFHYSDWLHENFPLPPFDALLTVQMDANVRQLIAHFFSYQFGMTQWDYDQGGETKPPVQTLSELKAKLLTDDPADDCILNMKNQGSGGGGHTVVPYRVVTDPVNSSLARIYVYDSNNPGNSDIYVIVDTSANTWTPMPDLGFTGGSKGLFLDLSVGNFQSRPILRELPSAYPVAAAPDVASPALYVLTDAGTEALIVSAQGDSVGFVGDLVIDNSPNMLALMPKTGTLHPPIGYRMIGGPFEVLLTNFAGETSNLTIIRRDAVYEYERESTAPGDQDRISIAGGLGIGNGGGHQKQIHLRAVVVEDSTEVRFDLLNVDLPPGDSLLIERQDSLSMKLENHGSLRTFDLSIERTSNLGVQQFHHTAIALPASSTGRIVAYDDSLEVIEMFVDQDHDGTIDDTLSYTNQSTGIDGVRGSTIPEKFRLAQNYPNPFNASTVIEYGLPIISHVTLKVYDVLGGEVATLVDEFQSAGNRQVRWDALGMASGVFYYRLTAGSFTEVKKLILIR